MGTFRQGETVVVVKSECFLTFSLFILVLLYLASMLRAQEQELVRRLEEAGAGGAEAGGGRS